MSAMTVCITCTKSIIFHLLFCFFNIRKNEVKITPQLWDMNTGFRLPEIAKWSNNG